MSSNNWDCSDDDIELLDLLEKVPDNTPSLDFDIDFNSIQISEKFNLTPFPLNITPITDNKRSYHSISITNQKSLQEMKSISNTNREIVDINVESIYLGLYPYVKDWSYILLFTSDLRLHQQRKSDFEDIPYNKIKKICM